MKLLVSVVNRDEVEEAITGGTDIIDIKNPDEGSLGAAAPWIIKEIIESVGSRRETSCAIGDLPNLPGTVSLAAAGAAALSPGYVKLGLFGTRNRAEALSVLEAAVDAVNLTAPSVKVIACGYGDYRIVGSVSPLDLPDIASSAGADGVLIDTINKDGRSLFDFLPTDDLKMFVHHARDLGLISALAGSLREQHIPSLRDCSPDVVGIRGVACSNADRVRGRVTSQRVHDFKSRLT